MPYLIALALIIALAAYLSTRLFPRIESTTPRAPRRSGTAHGPRPTPGERPAEGETP